MAASIAEFFLKNFAAHPNECAYRQRRGYRTQSFTYRQIVEMGAAVAGDLDERAIVKGDRGMLWGENSAEWVAAFFGGAFRGVVVVPMDAGASPDFAERVCHQVNARLLVASRAHPNFVDTSVPRLVLEDLSHQPPDEPVTAANL